MYPTTSQAHSGASPHRTARPVEPKRLTDTPLQRLLAAAVVTGIAACGETLARAFVNCPRAKSIVIASLHKSGGDYDECADMLSSAWMVIRDKYPDALGDAERIYQLTAAIAMRLAKRSAEGVRQRRRVVPLSVLHGKSADADDFAAFGDHVNRSLTDQTETSNEPPSEMLGITASHEDDVLRCLARDRLAARFATTVRPSGVNHAIADADIAVRRRVDVDPAREITSAPAFDTPAHEMTVLQRVRRLSICSGMAQQSLRGQMQWDTQHWNDVLRQRDGLNYEIGPRRAVRQRDLDALADAERLHITRDVLDLLKTLEKQGAVEVAGTWWATLKLNKGDSVTPLQKLVDIDKSFAALDPQCSRWRFREPADRTVVRAYLKLRDRLLTG